MAKKRTIGTRIVVSGFRRPNELGGGIYSDIGRFWLFFGDPNDIVFYMNQEGFSHFAGFRASCAQGKNAIMVVNHK